MNTYPTNIGYTAALRPHAELIKRVATQYANPNEPGRTDWTRALRAEPELANSLLVGPGPQEAQIKRLSSVHARLEGRYEKYKYNKRSRSVQPGESPRSANYAGSLCALLDQHRDALNAMAESHRGGPYNRVAWTRALEESPDLAQAIGYTDRSPEDKIKLIQVLGFWFRNRTLPHGPVPRNATSNGLPRSMLVPKPAVVQQPALPAAPAARPVLALNFCSHCGHPLAAEALAAGLIATLSSNGLSSDQIIDTLTRAAATVNRLAH